MKKLTKEQLKLFKGGQNEPIDYLDDSTLTCNVSCIKKNGTTNEYGTCSKKTIKIGGITSQFCACSITGGTGCS